MRFYKTNNMAKYAYAKNAMLDYYDLNLILCKNKNSIWHNIKIAAFISNNIYHYYYNGELYSNFSDNSKATKKRWQQYCKMLIFL